MRSERASGAQSTVRDPVVARESPGPDPRVAPGPAAVGPGTMLDQRYRLDEQVGQGGSATVFRATDTVLGRRVAVKVFHPDPPDAVLTERRAREMRLAAAASDPHLLAVFDAHLDRSDDTPAGPCYLVTEFVDGPNLAELIGPGGLTPAEVAHIGSGVARALSALHERGLVHRDVKPSNVLLTADHDAKLADLGIARELGGHPVTQDGAVPGTAPYLSPEQAEGKPVGPPSDVYSLGLVLLECLTGHREFPGAALESALARLLRDPEIPPTLPEPWPALLQSMTDRRADRRPPATVVTAILDGFPSTGADDPTSPRIGPLAAPAPADRAGSTAPVPRRDRHRQAGLLAGALAAVVATGAVLTLIALNRDPDPPPAEPAGGPALTTTLAVTPPTVTVTAPPPATGPEVGQPVTLDSAGSTGATAAGAPEPVAPTTSEPAPPAPAPAADPVSPTDAPGGAGGPAGEGPGNGGGNGNGNGNDDRGNGNDDRGSGNGNGNGNGRGNGGNGNGGNGNNDRGNGR